MPRGNRVDPFGRLIAVPERGDLMGNRGCLHDDDGVVVRPWRGKAWIACVTHVPGAPPRPLAAPGHYTVLFFRDEATALAAGHRPCGQCRRAAHRAFMAAWASAHGAAGVSSVDTRLHIERTASDGYRYAGDSVPDGTMIGSRDGERAWLAWHGWRRWSPAGYGEPSEEPPTEADRLLTPPAILATLRAGYRPQVHGLS